VTNTIPSQKIKSTVMMPAMSINAPHTPRTMRPRESMFRAKNRFCWRSAGKGAIPCK
jgi:hypothetical protein